MTTVSQAEFARRLGTARSYITALKAADRLVLTADGAAVELEASLQRIEETRDPKRSDVAERHASNRSATLLAAAAAVQTVSHIPAPSSDDEAISFQAARALKEKYAAKTARLDYEKAIGKLIERQAVEAAIEDVVTMCRERLEQLPYRVAPLLVEKPLDTVRATLKAEIREVLNELHSEFSTRIKELTPC